MQGSGCLAAGLTGTLAARRNKGLQLNSTQARSRVVRVEQPARWHVGVRLAAGHRAGVAAGWQEEADPVRAGAGQADSAPAALVSGADGGGRAGGDAAAVGSTASHGVGNLVCFWFLGRR